jgi:hypothetical protein
MAITEKITKGARLMRMHFSFAEDFSEVECT